MSGIKMIMPEHVFMNDDVHGQCTSGERWPHIVIKSNSGCNFKIERQRRELQDTNTLIYVTDFVVKSVTTRCEYMCVVGQLRETKTVVITGMYVSVYIYIIIYTCIMYRLSLRTFPLYRWHNITNTFKNKYF